MSERDPVTESDLQAYVDGRLAPARRAEVEDWLAQRPEEAERVTAYRAQRDELRASHAPALDEPVPERLRRAAQRRTRWRAGAMIAGWIALGAALGTLAGWQLHAIRPAPAPQAGAGAIARNAALAHVTYSPEVRHPVEVGADQETHLVAWLSRRLGASVRAPRLETEGMMLVGGRLLPGETGPVAHFMYQSDKGRRVTLYIRTEAPEHAETAFRYVREGGVRVFYWVDSRFGYALSSGDLEREELQRMANLVYRQFNP